jgi:transcriptional regulator with XRE-family HTH domain
VSWRVSQFLCIQGSVDKITKHVANTLRAARLAKGLTREELAVKLGMATESVSHFERAVTTPSLKTIAAAAAVLDVALPDLFVGFSERRSISQRRAEQEAVLRRLARDLDDRKLSQLLRLAAALDVPD